VAATAVVLLAGAYVAGYVSAGDTVPRKATVAGVTIGGLSSADAKTRLTEQLGPKQTAAVTLTAGEKSASIDPVTAGLSLDIPGTVAATGVGRSWSPVHIVRVLTGGADVAPVVLVDKPALDKAIATAATSLDVAAADATVRYEGTTPVRTPATSGIAVDQTATADAIVRAFGIESTVAAPSNVTEPAVTTEQADAVVSGWATLAVAGPVTLDTGKGKFAITPADIASSTTFSLVNGTFGGQVDYAKLLASATSEVSALQLGLSVDAKISLDASGKPAITPSKDGLTITPEKLAAAMGPLLAKPANQKTGSVEATVAKAAFTTEQAQALGIKEVVGEFTTYYPHAAYRNNNLGKAAAGINGSLLKPGDTFSLNKTLGERTAANGYVDGYVIQGGALVKEVGGGVSQSATTTYNAMFFAGLKDVEHHPHTFYIDRYPAGREATVYYGALDLRFQNDTQYGVYIQAYIKASTPSTKGSITVRMWSTKVWDEVRATDPVKTNFTEPATRVSTDPKCEPQGANQGFDVSYTRQFIRGGKVTREEKFSWHYAPEDKITCA
jgi:vancomycin resistance protein YoaR